MVPVGGFEYDAIRPIRAKNSLKEHFKLVSDLMDMEVASKILLASQHRLKGQFKYFHDWRIMSLNRKKKKKKEKKNSKAVLITETELCIYLNYTFHSSRFDMREKEVTQLV